MIFTKNLNKKGFTLMESVIAIGVVAILLTTFLAIFGPATQGIRRAISAEDADRLIASLEKELSILRKDEFATATNHGDRKYTSAFDKAYSWIGEASKNNKQGIILLNYRGDITSLRTDGKPTPVTGKLAGQDYVVTPSVSFFDGTVSTIVDKELQASSGPVVFVKTKQLVYNSKGELELGSAGIKPPREGQSALGGSGSDSYPDATIAFSADFYLLPTNSKAYIDNLQVNNLGKPLFTRNLAARR